MKEIKFDTLKLKCPWYKDEYCTTSYKVDSSKEWPSCTENDCPFFTCLTNCLNKKD